MFREDRHVSVRLLDLVEYALIVTSDNERTRLQMVCSAKMLDSASKNACRP